MAEKIKLKIDRERLMDNMTVDELIAVEEGNVRGVKAALTHFMLNDKGEYYDPKESARIVGKMKVRDLMELVPQIREAVEGAADAGPLSESVSTTSTDTE